ncbi:MAG: glycosyltransferase [Deltaproteobacteria bacterium]|nr:glycosyltransferase [Deltaproteobacteria bacterium]
MRDEQLKAALGYRRFTGAPRVLVFDTGYLTVSDVVDGATDLGWSVSTLETKAKGSAEGDFVANLLKALVLQKPDFVLTINHLGFDEQGILAGLLARYEIPTASWFVDHPLPIIGGANRNATPHTQVFCFERTALSWIGSQGYADPVYLPTGSNQRHFHPDRIDRARAQDLASELAFVGNSWWTKARVEPSEKMRKAARAIGRKIHVCKQTLAGDFAGMLENVDVPVNVSRARYLAAQIALAEASMETRGRFARALMPAGLRIHGDPHWARLAPGIDLRPGIDYKAGLPALFAGTFVNANVTAEQMPTAVNQRVWDVPATGAFLLTDAQEDALELFDEDSEIVVYRDFEEAADKAKYYIDHRELRDAIAARAFSKVERAHRITHRLEDLARVMQQRFG